MHTDKSTNRDCFFGRPAGSPLHVDSAAKDKGWSYPRPLAGEAIDVIARHCALKIYSAIERNAALTQ
jgi:hypothetical protein